jgi:hypothetical protein
MPFQTNQLFVTTRPQQSSTILTASDGNLYTQFTSTNNNTFTGALSAFYVDQSNPQNVFFNKLSGNVGIQTSTPQYSLDVNSTARVGDGMIMNSNIVSRKMYAFIATGTSTNPIQTTITFTNEAHSAQVCAMIMNENGISSFQNNCIGGTLNGSYPPYNITEANAIILASSGATISFSDTTVTSPTQCILNSISAPISPSEVITIKINIVLVAGTITQISTNFATPITKTYNY